MTTTTQDIIVTMVQNTPVNVTVGENTPVNVTLMGGGSGSGGTGSGTSGTSGSSGTSGGGSGTGGTGTDGTSGTSGTSGITFTGFNYYYRDISSDISGSGGILLSIGDCQQSPKMMIAGRVQAGSGTSFGTAVLIEAYATTTGDPNTNQIPSGNWKFVTWGYVNDATGISRLEFDIYSRSTTGSETLLFSDFSPEINSTNVATPDRVVNESFQSAFSVGLTDRLIVKVSAQTNAGAPKTVHYLHSGTNYASYINSPIVTALLGSAGTSGTSGTSSVSTSGTSGISGSSGSSGTSPPTTTSGTSGTTWPAPTSGTSGVSGSSGTSGVSGSSGTSPPQTTSGTSGLSGSSGTSGLQGSGYYGTSVTACTTGIGSRTFTTNTGLAYIVGNRVRAIAFSTAYMDGAVTAYTAASGSLTMNVDTTQGFGTYSSWGFGICGTGGTSGTSGISGSSGTSPPPTTSGTSGVSGSSGTSPPTSTSGTSGTTGTSGTSGASASGALIWALVFGG